ncbi:MAG: metal ABC transporter permease [Planctomycetota bacterium]|jgi:zinc transport system permease protein|nr:metal ABC transporter permease [Planctomycetota bacterium]
MMAGFLDALALPFVQRAFLVGTLVSLCASLLGMVLVLKRYALIGHGLADVGFASLTIGLALGFSPLLFSAPVVIAASFVIMLVSQRYGASGDVAIGVSSTGALALGVIVAARTKGFNVDVYDYMFGSVLATSRADAWLSIGLALTVLLLFILFYNRLFLVAYDETFARAGGVNLAFYQFLISFLTALTVVVGMRMMGTLLISSLIIFPGVTARRLATGFRSMAVFAAIISVVCFAAGMAGSFALDWPVGASVVAANVACYLIVLIYVSGRLKKINRTHD